MKGVNKVILVGRLGNEIKQSALASGAPVVNFSLATSEKYKDKRTGENKEATEWHSLVAYDKLADIIAMYATKGMAVYIEGKLRTRNWEDNGTKRYKTEVIVNAFQMIEGKSADNWSQA